MMTSAQFFFCLTCLLLGKMVQRSHLTPSRSSPSVTQDSGFISTNIGDTITLRCFYNHSTLLFWYMQPLGEKPKLISTFYDYGMVTTFHDKFNNNSRFSLDTKNDKHHLTISDLTYSDSATYYCAISSEAVLIFGDGATVSVKGSGFNLQVLVHQSAPQIMQTGDSPWLPLNCAVHSIAVKCDGKQNKHTLYRFKDSEDVHPAYIYAHGENNDQGERKSNKESQSCAYNLPNMNLTLSDPGTIYCAVASCGHILFGNKTKVDAPREVDSILVYFLTGALIFTTILVVLLIIAVHQMNKTSRCQSADERFPAPPTADVGWKNQDADNPQYAALDLNQVNRLRRQKSSAESTCVYSSVKQLN
ncbi:uncharacterized protein LOC133420182 isoform X2 [Cololabis saira]|uniref:uncharacterized protein LOC133420182 isoform X2 n=1 Tax=Cololabis saira TaxID=129043 RepID=UPI002AD4902C|nr:uncharacterized protein LOC133420182 isoform X2 [Cololabis saira]